MHLGRQRRVELGIILALAGLVVATYAPVRGFDFVQLDDPIQVTENPSVVAGLTWTGVVWAFSSVHAGYWMPLVWLSHMVDVQVYGLEAGGHHITNVLLHLANTLMLFGLLSRATGGPGRSACVAALFAVHPLHVESVAWITERKDVLSTFFWLLTFRAYASFTRLESRGRYLLLCLAFGLALMSKPMTVTLPLTLLLIDVWPLARLSGARGFWRLVQEKIPLFGLSAAVGLAAMATQQQAGAMASLEASALSARVANAVASYVAYLVKTLWPADLSVLYPLRGDLSRWEVAGSALFVAAVTGAAIRMRRRRPALTVGWFWYLVTLLPVIGLVQVGLQGMADRFTYVPLIGIFVAAVWGVHGLAAGPSVRGRWLPMLALAIVVASAIVARHQLQYWRNNRTLFTRATMVSLGVDPYQAHLSLARSLIEAGRAGEAADHLADALALQPDSAEAHTHLGLLLVRQGAYERALPHFAEAARLQPGVAGAHANLGATLIKLGRFREASAALTEALRLDPSNEPVRRGLREIAGRQ